MKTILLDFDGVLIESSKIKLDAFIELFSGYEAHDKIREYILNNEGMNRYVLFRNVYEQILMRELKPKIEEQLGKEFSTFVLSRIRKCPLVSGTHELLDMNYDFYLVSATPEPELIQIVKEKGLFEKFKRIYGAPLDKANVIKHILDENSYEPKDVIFVGDTMRDYISSLKAGVNFIGRVKGKNPFPDNVETVGDMAELSALLHNMY